jgi:hypothetical protein
MRFMENRVRPNDVLAVLRSLLDDDSEWARFLRTAPSVHLAVLVEPFLKYLLEGRKTIETRFSLNRIAPFNRVTMGDLVLLKRSSGPIVGVARVELPEFFILNKDTWPKVRAFSAEICADEGFWRARQEKRYATLLHLGQVRVLGPIQIRKKDPRPWLILRDTHQSNTGRNLCA